MPDTLSRAIVFAEMPADIRSFFGGGPKASQGSQDTPKKDEVCSLCAQPAARIRMISFS